MPVRFYSKTAGRDQKGEGRKILRTFPLLMKKEPEQLLPGRSGSPFDGNSGILGQLQCLPVNHPLIFSLSPDHRQHIHGR